MDGPDRTTTYTQNALYAIEVNTNIIPPNRNKCNEGIKMLLVNAKVKVQKGSPAHAPPSSHAITMQTPEMVCSIIIDIFGTLTWAS